MNNKNEFARKLMFTSASENFKINICLFTAYPKDVLSNHRNR